MQNNFQKNPIIYRVTIIINNAIFACSTSLHMLKTFLNLLISLSVVKDDRWKLQDWGFKSKGIQKSSLKQDKRMILQSNSASDLLITFFECPTSRTC